MGYYENNWKEDTLVPAPIIISFIPSHPIVNHVISTSCNRSDDQKLVQNSRHPSHCQKKWMETGARCVLMWLLLGLLIACKMEFCYSCSVCPSSKGVYRCEAERYSSCVTIFGSENMRDITVFSCNVRILKIHWPEMQNPIIRDRQRNICKGEYGCKFISTPPPFFYCWMETVGKEIDHVIKMRTFLNVRVDIRKPVGKL